MKYISHRTEEKSQFIFIFFYTDRAKSSLLNNNILPNAYSPRSNSSIVNPDLSKAFRVDAHLLAIIRVEDKRSKFEDFFFKLFV
jgi:hypothetical protein